MRISVFGPPGCGKSSLISALFGLTEHDNRASCDNGVTVHTWEWRPQGGECCCLRRNPIKKVKRSFIDISKNLKTFKSYNPDIYRKSFERTFLENLKLESVVCVLSIQVSLFTEDADDKGRELLEIWEWSGKKVRVTSLYK